MLDEGRSLLWTEMRRFREPPVLPGMAGDELAMRFESVRFDLQAMSTAEARYESLYTVGDPVNAKGPSNAGIPYDVLLSRKQELLEEYEKLRGRIREKPGLENFLRNLPFGKLQEAAKEVPSSSSTATSWACTLSLSSATVGLP